MDSVCLPSCLRASVPSCLRAVISGCNLSTSPSLTPTSFKHCSSNNCLPELRSVAEKLPIGSVLREVHFFEQNRKNSVNGGVVGELDGLSFVAGGITRLER